MTIAQEIVEAAYNRSSANDPGKLALDTEMLAHANRLYQRFYALYARARPDETASTLAVTPVGNPGTVTLAPNTIAVLRVLTAVGAPVHLIPPTETARSWHMAPSMYRLGNSLVSRARGGDPLAGDALTLVLVPAPAALLTLTTAIDPTYPVRHLQLLVDALALYLDAKDDGRSMESHAKLVTEFGQALAAFAQEYDVPPDALEWAHQGSSRSKAPA